MLIRYVECLWGGALIADLACAAMLENPPNLIGQRVPKQNSLPWLGVSFLHAPGFANRDVQGLHRMVQRRARACWFLGFWHCATVKIGTHVDRGPRRGPQFGDIPRPTFSSTVRGRELNPWQTFTCALLRRKENLPVAASWNVLACRGSPLVGEIPKPLFDRPPNHWLWGQKNRVSQTKAPGRGRRSCWVGPDLRNVHQSHAFIHRMVRIRWIFLELLIAKAPQSGDKARRAVLAGP